MLAIPVRQVCASVKPQVSKLVHAVEFKQVCNSAA